MTGEQLILNRLERIEMMLERMVSTPPVAQALSYGGAVRGGKSFALRVAEADAAERRSVEKAARRVR